MTTGKTTLFLIDVQKDFHPGGSLAIPTANEDAERIAGFIRSSADKIDRIVATMDSHQKLHIAHPYFWTNKQEEHPPPFTIITPQDIESGTWIPRNDLSGIEGTIVAEVFGDLDGVCNADGTLNIKKYCLEYSKRLEKKGRFKLCIWPEHCLIGTDGHGIVNSVRDAMNEWSDKTGGSVEWVWKGQDLLTEMYSALAAEVPINSRTNLQRSTLQSLLNSERIFVAGQAMSHCVNYTLRDLVDNWPEGKTKNKLCLLTDCASPVPGFEEAADIFQKDMKEAGITLCTSRDVMAE